MNEDTLLALWESIEHWQENVLDPSNASIYAEDCPLCHRFGNECERLRFSCTANLGGFELCPVSECTGERYCLGSPWCEVEDCLHDSSHEKLREAMQKELAFLVDLLPDQE